MPEPEYRLPALGCIYYCWTDLWCDVRAESTRTARWESFSVDGMTIYQVLDLGVNIHALSQHLSQRS